MIATLPETARHEARSRAALARTTLTEVAALEPAERHALVQIVDEAIKGLEELLSRLFKTFEGGVSLSEAGVVGRLLTRSANLISSSVELVASGTPKRREWKDDGLERLRRVKENARVMKRLAGLPPPVLDAERMRRSLAEMERGEGCSSADILGELHEE